MSPRFAVPRRRFAAALCAIVWLVAWLALSSCKVDTPQIQLPPLKERVDEDTGRVLFTCRDLGSRACENTVLKTCRQVDEFLEAVEVDCAMTGKVCELSRGCITCIPGSRRCAPCEDGDTKCNRNIAQQCNEEGDAWDDIAVCDLAEAQACYEGMCRDMCEQAKVERSYVGCEFYAADLDNAAIDDINNASAQQYAVAVANPQPVEVHVKVEINEAPYGEPLEVQLVEERDVAPGALEVFELPRREVDGSSQDGLDDGTDTALTSNAYRVEASHPLIAYQFNPLENSNVFSNDASLLLPTSAVGTKYTVVSWPETIGDSENPDQDFDSTSSSEDLRAFLTILGTEADTMVKVLLGNKVKRVVGAGIIPESLPGQEISVTLGRFDVLNLETGDFMADFTGSLVTSSKPVTVFVGSEASDVPMFGTYETRQCCADHLEEQLIPDSTLGSRYAVARMPARTRALRAAQFEDDPFNVALVNEPEWIRVIATAPGVTRVKTTLPAPSDEFELEQGAVATLRADQDFMIDSGAQAVAVLQATPSQGVTGIPKDYPGGDPDLIVVPPIQQYRKDYVFLTPDKYAFDFVTIMAEASTNILLDGEPLPDTCTMTPADGNEPDPGEDEPERVNYSCQLSFPKVTSAPNSQTLPGDQNDGVHTVVADRPVGIIVSGFDRFVSYAYVGGLNLEVIN